MTTVETVNQGGNARMIIEPKGLWEHSAYQTDNRFIIEVKPVLEDPNKLTQGSRQGYKGERLSLNFQNVEVRAVLQVIADFTGLNIITSDTVSGSLTLRLKDIPWDQALDIIMQTKGLDMRKNGNVVLIAPREELALKEKQQLESQIQISELEPLVSESFQLNYMKASDLLNLLTTNTQQQFGAGAGQTATTGGQGSILSKRGVAIVDPRSNILFVQDTASRLEEVRKIIRQLDTPIRQVLIEARIVIAERQVQQAARRALRRADRASRSATSTPAASAARSTRSRWSRPTATAWSARRGRRRRSSSRRASPRAGYSDSPQLNVNLPVPNPAGQLALTLINLGSGNLINLELQALESDARGKVVSSPRVVTGDNQKARIEQGTEIPYVTAGLGELAGDRRSSRRRCCCSTSTPQITPDNRIIMTVEIRKDSVGQYVAAGRRLRGAVDRHQERDHADRRQQRRHRGHRRHLRRDDQQRRHQGAVPRRPADRRLGVQAAGTHQREDRAPDLPHAARRQGHGRRGEVGGAARAAARVGES